MKKTAITFLVTLLVTVFPILVSTAFSDVSPNLPGKTSVVSKPIRPLPYCTDMYIQNVRLDNCDTNCAPNAALVGSITVTVSQRNPNPDNARHCIYKPASEYDITLRYTSYLTKREETLKYAFVVGAPQQVLDQMIFYIKTDLIKINVEPRGKDFIDHIKSNNSVVVGAEPCTRCDENPDACMN